MGRLLGPPVEESYDWPGPAPAGLPELAEEMRAVLLRYGPAGCPLWPPVASSAYAALLRRGDGPLLLGDLGRVDSRLGRRGPLVGPLRGGAGEEGPAAGGLVARGLGRQPAAVLRGPGGSTGL